MITIIIIIAICIVFIITTTTTTTAAAATTTTTIIISCCERLAGDVGVLKWLRVDTQNAQYWKIGWKLLFRA